MTSRFPSLLITDNDQSFRETLRGMFEPYGFRTFVAGDGEEALRIVQDEEVHVALLDMHMPRLTGLETIRRVKQFQSRLPCILISAALDETIVRQAQLFDAFSVLAKPVSRNQLTDIVDQAMWRTYQWRLRDLPDFPCEH